MIKNNRGFTLVELVIVITIFTILAAVAMPYMAQWITQADFREASQNVLQILNQGRSRAVSRNLEQRVEFDLTNHQFRLVEGNRSANSSNFDTVVLKWTGLPATVILKRTTTCDDTSDTSFQFNPNGSSSSGYICIMDAKNPTVKKFKVGVANSNTGRVTVE